MLEAKHSREIARSLILINKGINMNSSKKLWGIKKASAIVSIYADARKAALDNPFASAAIFSRAYSQARQVAQTPQFYDATLETTIVSPNFNQA